MWVLFAILNPISEGFRILFGKKSAQAGVDPLLISWSNNLVPFILFTPFLFFLDIHFNKEYVTALAVSGTINVVGQILYMKAISEGDISEVAPMLSFTPLFLILTSPAIVGEFPGVRGSFGVILIVLGSYLLNFDLKNRNILAPFKSLVVNKGTRYMLTVSLLWSVSANFDKVAVLSSSVWQHIIFLNLFIFSGITIVNVIFNKFDFKKLKAEKINLGAMSAFMGLSMFFHLTAVSMIYVSYVVALKRASGLVSVIFGHYFLGEGKLRERAVGASIMFIGVLLIILS